MSTSKSSDALAIVHDVDGPPGRLVTWADRRGIALDVFQVFRGEPFPEPSDWQFVVTLGSRASVTDGFGWIKEEIAFLGELDERDVPVLGCCFGAQILAVALGGSVRRSTRPEIGWHTIETKRPRLIGPGPWFEWHHDAIVSPPDATELAHTDLAVQAFSLRRHLGLQFHPEVSYKIIRSWTQADHAELTEHGVDERTLRAQSLTRESGSRRSAEILFDAFLAGRFAD